MPISKLSIKNPVFANMIMIAVIVIGTYSFIILPRELVSEMSFNWALITTRYVGASPEEVENLITKPIEDEIADVDGIDMITSMSSEGISIISVKFERMNEDRFDKVFQDLCTEVDKARGDLPQDAEFPDVVELNTSEWIPMIDVVLSGDIPEKQMFEIADDLEDDILNIKGVSSVAVSGVHDRQIWVEVDQYQIDRYHITLSQVAQRLAARNLNVPGGTIESGREEYLLRTLGEFEKIEDIKNVIVRWHPGGRHLRIKDLATVSDTYEKPKTLSRLDGRKAISMVVVKKPEGSSIAIIDEIKQIKKKYEEQRLPPGAKIALIADTSVIIKRTLGILQSNAIIGIVLVLAVLYLFLGWRNALFVALGMPVTFAATFIFMDRIGDSLNSASLFGLVLVLGMIVDDAIVITENVYRHIQRGTSPTQAAVSGVSEVARPVFTSSLTTMAALLPLAFIPGLIGQFMKIVPIVVSLALAASLFEVFFILPAHIAEWGKKRTAKHLADHLFTPMVNAYIRILKSALRWRYLVVVALILCAVGSAFVIRFQGMELFATDEISLLYVRIWMPPNTKLAATDEIVRKIEGLALELPKSEVEGVIANTGFVQTETFEYWRSNIGQVVVDLVEPEYRKRSLDEILDYLRRKIQHIEGIDHIEFAKVDTGPPAGKAVSLKVKGVRLDELETVAELVKAELKAIEGVYDVNDDFSLGKEELQIRLKEDRAQIYGLSVAQVAQAVRTAFEGTVATIYRDGDEAVDVVVKLRENTLQSAYVKKNRSLLVSGVSYEVLPLSPALERSEGEAKGTNCKAHNRQEVENLKLLTPTGSIVPLKDVAEFAVKRGYATIHRFQRERAITISADVDKRVTTAVAVNRCIERRFAEISRQHPGYDLDFRGQFAEFNESMASMKKLLAIGVIFIYLILGAQFKSFVQPLIILFTVPFAFIGAMFGLLVTGYPFSVATMFGIVALAGIVVNDSVVFIDFINKQRPETQWKPELVREMPESQTCSGLRRWKSILKAGRLRLRPILLTSITTIFGLLPMTVGLGGKSPIWMSLANTIVWGLLVATILTLFVIPALYAIVDDVEKLRD